MFYSASMHANEWTNSVVMMKFVEDFAEAYTNHTEILGYNIRQIFTARTIYLMPMVNPDGVDLVLNNIPRSSPFYREARRIANQYEEIPFPNGWKANIRGVDFKRHQPEKSSNHLYLRVS